MATSPIPDPRDFSLWKLAKYFLWLGSVGFGGPISLLGYMSRELTDKRQWVSRQDFLNGLALSSLCPGPLATQLAIYLGWVKAKTLGATVVLFAFTLPAFLMILSIAVLYTHYAHITWIQKVFYGVSASVIAIVIRNGFKLSKMIIIHDHWLWGLFGLNLLIVVGTNIQMYWSFLLSGTVVWLIKAPPRFFSKASLAFPLLISINAFSNHHILWKLFFYFTWAGTVVFGSGFAIIPFIHEGVVHHHHWISETQFLDAIGISMITPGPVVLAVSFIGYLVAGVKGAIVASIGVFLPCYLCVVFLAPHFNRIAHHDTVRAFVQGITIAAAGIITGVTLLLAKDTLMDWFALSLFLGTSAALYLFKKIPDPVWVFLCGGISGILKGSTLL